MKKIITEATIAILIAALFATGALANPIGPDNYTGEWYESLTRTGQASYDGSDAPDSYGAAWHTTDGWQRLGNEWRVDDGVYWSTDGGLTWGHDTLYVGQSVQFGFDFQRTNDGVHTYDQIKAWVDWDKDSVFDNSDGSDELVYARQWWADYTLQNLGTYEIETIQSFFVTDTFLVPESALGTTWLRARVHCWHTPFDQTGPTGYLSQGEVEDWQLTVEATPTPEPSTMVLLAIGMAGTLAWTRRSRG